MTNKCHKWQSVTKTNKSWQKTYLIFNYSLLAFAYYVPPQNILIDLIIFILIHHILLYIIWWYDSIQTDHQQLGGCRLPVLVYCAMAMSELTNATFCSDLVPGSYLNVKDFSYAQRRFFTLLSVATLKTFELKSQIWLFFFRFCHVVLIEWEWTGTGSNWLRAETPVILECGAWLECASSSWAGGGGH